MMPICHAILVMNHREHVTGLHLQARTPLRQRHQALVGDLAHFTGCEGLQAGAGCCNASQPRIREGAATAGHSQLIELDSSL